MEQSQEHSISTLRTDIIKFEPNFHDEKLFKYLYNLDLIFEHHQVTDQVIEPIKFWKEFLFSLCLFADALKGVSNPSNHMAFTFLIPLMSDINNVTEVSQFEFQRLDDNFFIRFTGKKDCEWMKRRLISMIYRNHRNKFPPAALRFESNQELIIPYARYSHPVGFLREITRFRFEYIK